MTKSSTYNIKRILAYGFTWNLARVENLVRLYEVSTKMRGRKPSNSTDILRSAVVLLHASFEELLRELAHYKLPVAGEHVLDDIPLVGINSSGRPEKFFLGRLAAHRNKTVEQVIQDSVTAHLNLFTVSSIPDLTNFLNSMGIPVEPVKHLFPSLGDMIKRRHQIVHNADRRASKVPGQRAVQSIKREQVLEWLGAIEEFLSIIQRVPWEGEA